MLIQDELKPIDQKAAASLPLIANDEVAEEVYAARQYAKRLTRTGFVFMGLAIVVLSIALYNVAMRPAKRVYIKLDQFNRATAIKYSDLEHYTPDAAVAKNYLSDWATFRYERLTASVLKTFPKNYLFLESKFGKAVRDRDTKDNVVAYVLAGREPENSISIESIDITSWGKQSLADNVVVGGTAVIKLYKTFTKDEKVYQQLWHISVRFYINPDTPNMEEPEYQSTNPLGLAIVEFYASRPNMEPAQVKK